MSASVSARLTRQSGTSFYYAFRILPVEKRRATYALYAFCRVVDDCVDEPDGEREAGLVRWTAELDRAYAGVPQTELGRELAETVARFPIPRGAFEDIVAGCRMDLTTRRYATFAELRGYCERVASAVGLASIEIFGYDDPRTREYAVELGLALQLTNVLRDIAQDAARDRIYLPLEDLARFGVSESEFLAAAADSRAPRPAGLAGLLAFETERARSHYAASARALPDRDRHSMRAAEIMGAVYRAVLEEWVRRGHPVGGPRVQLSKPRKLWIALATLARDAWGRMKVVVLGGGFAGFAAATWLQERRHEVVLLERRGILGGRATSWRDTLTGDEVDNGTHLMIGGYQATLDLLHRAGASDLLLFQDELKLEWVDERGVSALDCPPLAAPLHLLAGLVGLRLPLAVKLQAIRLGLAVRFGRPPVGLTLAEYLRRSGQGEVARRLLWDPLAIAILNESADRAAAVLFHRVYHEAFLRDHRASRLVFPRRGWGTLLERLAAYFESRGGVVRRGARAEALVLEEGRARAVRFAQRSAQREEIATGAPPEDRFEPADAVVSALPPPALLALLSEALRARPAFRSLEQFGGSPIVSVDLWLDRVVVDRLMLGLRDADMDWVFDKGRLHGRVGAPQHLAFVASAAYRSAPKPNAELVAAATGALRRYFPAMADATVTRSLVQREPQATFASTPELEALRPGPVSEVPGLFLAGDWTDTGLPATIEGAVRSGRRAADALVADGQSR